MGKIIFVVLVLAVAACQEEIYPAPPNAGEMISGAEEVDHLPILRRAEIFVHHVHTDWYGIHCSTDPGPQSLLITSLHTDTPKVDGSDPPYVCEPLNTYANILQLSCKRYHHDFVPWYWEYMDLWMQRGWEGKYSGWQHNFVDGEEYFWCNVEFQIDDVKLIYF